MPHFRIPIANLDESFLRPLIWSVTRDINKKIGVSPDAPVFYPGEYGVSMQLNSKIKQDGDKASHEQNGSLFGANELISIEADEMFDDSLRDTPVNKDEYMPIFRDTKLGIAIRPVYMPCIMNLSYKYRCKDRGQADIIRNKIRSKMTFYGDLLHHNLKYHYLIPDEVYFILRAIWERRENIAGYGDSFEHYLFPRSDRMHSSVRISKVTNSNASHDRYAVSENQTRVFGYYDFQVAPDKGSREKEDSTYTLSFNYKLRYSKPIEIKMDYPIMVHQQLIPIPFIPKPEDTMYEQGLGEERHFSLTGIAFERWTVQEYHRLKNIAKYDGISIPNFDEWVPEEEYKIPGTRRLVDLLLSLATQQPCELVDIKNINHIGFSDRLLEFMHGEAKWMKHRHESVFQCDMYNQFGLLHKRYIEVDDNLKINSILPLTLRNMYHIRLALYEDWSLLSYAARQRLANYPDIIKDLLQYLGYDWDKICKELNKLQEKYHHVNTENRLRGQRGKIWRNEEGKLVEPPPVEGYKSEWETYKRVPDFIMDKLIQLISGKTYIDIRELTVETFFIEAYRDEETFNNGIYYY